MPEFDFIVVGTGSGGATVGNRLSEVPSVTVLALEAGSTDFPENTTVAPLWYTLLGSSIDWGYQSIPQPGLNGRQTYEPRGKAPGGSSNLYIMMHIRGAPRDYDNWAYNGAPGWTYNECLPYFQKLEDQKDDTNPTGGKGGPIPVISAGDFNPNPVSRVFIDACLELGYPPTDDFNGPHMEGVGWHHINAREGKRGSTYQGYVEPALKRLNYMLEPNAQASRLLFDGKRCIGVEYFQYGEKKTAHARREVIVACGAIESPKLLQLSGIGNPALLREFDIPVVADIPGVGENFHNHVLAGVIQDMKQPVPPGRNNLSEAALFCQSSPAGWGVPDLQMAFVHVPFNIIVGQGHPNAVSILPGLERVLSRGWVRLASRDPLAKPLINPNYLGDRGDMERLLQATKLSRRIFQTDAFSQWAAEELMPGPSVQTDDEFRAFLRATADSYHHQVGSCKMGLDDQAVVDPQLRVHGIDGLRIADASVMPTIQSGNTHTGIVMVAERCADFIKKAHNLT